MSKKSKLQPRYFRSTPATIKAMERLVAAVTSEEGCEDWNQGEVITASWHWMESLDAAELARNLAPHVTFVRERFQQARDEEKAEVDQRNRVIGTETTPEKPSERVQEHQKPKRRGSAKG